MQPVSSGSELVPDLTVTLLFSNVAARLADDHFLNFFIFFEAFFVRYGLLSTTFLWGGGGG
jgi:hypothetical protein